MNAAQRQQGRPRTPIEHGTEAGYQKHRRYGPPIDAADSCGCRRANREATSVRMARHTPKPRKRDRRHPPVAVTSPGPGADTTLHRTVARHVVWATRTDDTTPAADARVLLEALGLVAPGGRHITPDDTGPTRVPVHAPKGSQDPPPSKGCTTPAGLRGGEGE